MAGFQMFVGAVFLTLTLAFGGVWVFQTYGIYRFDQTPQSPQTFGLAGVRAVTFISEDGAPVQAWLAVPAPGRPVLFSFYGNFAGIGPSMQRISPLLEGGTGIVMLQYRGSGGTAGQPSEENFVRDARALYDQLDILAGQTLPPNRRVLHGFSLGSGVALHLATDRPFAGVVLEAAIPRLCQYFQRRYHGVPLCPLMWAERYDSLDSISRLTAPLLFLHGTQDADIPVAWGRQLYDAAKAPKRFVEIPAGGHANLAQYGLIPAMQAFVQETLD